MFDWLIRCLSPQNRQELALRRVNPDLSVHFCNVTGDYEFFLSKACDDIDGFRLNSRTNTQDIIERLARFSFA